MAKIRVYVAYFIRIFIFLRLCTALKDAPLVDKQIQETVLDSGQVIVRKSMSQSQALVYCENRTSGGRLTVLPTLEDAVQLVTAIRKVSNPWTNDDDIAQFTYEFHMSRRYWIGLMDVTKEGEWRWAKVGLELDYDKMWYNGQPDHILRPEKSKGEHCVTLWNPIFYENGSHTFNDENCENKYYPICEVSSNDKRKRSMMINDGKGNSFLSHGTNLDDVKPEIVQEIVGIFNFSGHANKTVKDKSQGANDTSRISRSSKKVQVMNLNHKAHKPVKKQIGVEENAKVGMMAVEGDKHVHHGNKTNDTLKHEGPKLVHTANTKEQSANTSKTHLGQNETLAKPVLAAGSEHVNTFLKQGDFQISTNSSTPKNYVKQDIIKKLVNYQQRINSGSNNDTQMKEKKFANQTDFDSGKNNLTNKTMEAALKSSSALISHSGYSTVIQNPEENQENSSTLHSISHDKRTVDEEENSIENEKKKGNEKETVSKEMFHKHKKSHWNTILIANMSTENIKNDTQDVKGILNETSTFKPTQIPVVKGNGRQMWESEHNQKSPQKEEKAQVEKVTIHEIDTHFPPGKHQSTNHTHWQTIKQNVSNQFEPNRQTSVLSKLY